MKIKIFLITTLFVLSQVLIAQDTEVSNKERIKLQKKAAKDSIRNKKVAEGKFIISPIVAPGYTPELGGLVAFGGLMSFKTNPTDDLIQRSSFPVTLAYTTTGAVVANGILSSYWFEDKLRIYGDFWYKDMPDHYWGIGYQNGYEKPKGEETTSYNRQWWWFNPRFLYQFKKNYFVGLNVDYNYTKGTNPSAGVGEDPNYIKYKDKPLNSGLGLMLRYDSRDIPVDSREGMLVDLVSTFYSTGLGGDNKYQIYSLDYRQFETVNREGMTLAWQLKARIAAGDVPYGEMSQLGTPFDLRGYQWGRFRDESMFFFLAEYRHMFLDKSGEVGKHGAVVWAGSGTIFDFDTLADNTNQWLPNFGVGYRLELQPRMHMRLDYGIGRETSGIYFNFNQAF
ncbi:BamA/TamA family outer membrane protein [Labilibacter marinus]|uniref:BamA/TamA family outer membrane protein n=1 Tax=Labilibacter marinus TaxID=1477105 RepID=UPI0009501335|nr:BamA/TamA family outer membrane protein [Labilibacter marinus]